MDTLLRVFYYLTLIGFGLAAALFVTLLWGWAPILFVCLLLLLVGIVGFLQGKRARGLPGPIGYTEDALVFYRHVRSGMGYHTVCLAAGHPGRLISLSAGYSSRAIYVWVDTEDRATTVCFSNGKVDFQDFTP